MRENRLFLAGKFGVASVNFGQFTFMMLQELIMAVTWLFGRKTFFTFYLIIYW